MADDRHAPTNVVAREVVLCKAGARELGRCEGEGVNLERGRGNGAVEMRR